MRLDRAFTTTLGRAILAVAGCMLLTQTSAEAPLTGVEELAVELRSRPGLEVEVITQLPPRLRGPLKVIGRYDPVNSLWEQFEAEQEYGSVDALSIDFLGYHFGSEGFVLVHYPNVTDRAVVTYASVTTDRKMALYLTDDGGFAGGLVLTVWVGPEATRYLVRRVDGQAKQPKE